MGQRGCSWSPSVWLAWPGSPLSLSWPCSDDYRDIPHVIHRHSRWARVHRYGPTGNNGRKGARQINEGKIVGIVVSHNGDSSCGVYRDGIGTHTHSNSRPADN